MTSVALWPLLPVGLALVAVALTIVLLVARRDRLGEWLRQAADLSRADVLLIITAAVLSVCLAMVVSLVGRVKLDNAIRAQQITRSDVNELARVQAKLAQPTVKEQLRRIGQALDTCAASSACRRKFVRTVNRVIRVENGTLRPRPGRTSRSPQIPSRPPAQGLPSRPKVMPPRVVTVPGPAGKDGRDGRDGAPGKPGKQLDSALLDGTDNRLTDVERALADVQRGLATVLGKLPGIDRITAALCRTLRLLCN